MNMHPSLDDSPCSSFADHRAWRLLSWVGVALQALAALVAWQSARLGGLWIILVFLGSSVAFLVTTRHLPKPLVFMAMLAAAINAGGWAWNWYDAVPWFDEFVHTYNPFVITAASMFWFWQAKWVKAPPGSGRFVFLAAGYGLAIGIAWEFLEMFFLDLGLWDTITDLAFDTVGAALGGWLSGRLILRLGCRRIAEAECSVHS